MTYFFKKWIPDSRISDLMTVEKLVHDSSGLRIYLSSEQYDEFLCIEFPHNYTYRNTDESYRLRLWSHGQFEVRQWTYFITRESELIDWVVAESESAYDKDNMIHYLIKTGSDVIDIVTNSAAPKTKWVQREDCQQIGEYGVRE